MKRDLGKILASALEAADPGAAVLRSVEVDGDTLTAGGMRFEAGRVFVVAVGKAAGAMTMAAKELLGERIAGGVVVTKDEHQGGPEGMETLFASHPEPDERGVEAARRVEEVASSLEEGDLLLALVSGGASALLADAAPPIEIGDLRELTTALLRSGADIGEINTVRKHVSVLKGGNLVRLASPSPVLALLLSDVVGDAPSSIASGLTAPDPTTLDDTRAVLRRYGIDPPRAIVEHLEKAEETPKPGDKVFGGVANVICGGGRHAAEAAAARARELGYEPMLLSTTITGDARAIASVHAAVVREVLESGNPVGPPCALVSAGEATVIVRGDGTGGPNQEFSLQLAVELDGVEGWAALAVDTDGNDGSTDAAGGLVSGATAPAIRGAQIDPADALSANDAYPALKAAGALVVTGPTGTNVNDVRVVLVRDPGAN